MTVTAGGRRPVVAALYRKALPPRLSEIEESRGDSALR